MHSTKKNKHHIISWIAVCFLIYIGLWTTAWRDIPSHVDEDNWLEYSTRIEAAFYQKYPETFEVNYSSIDQLTTSAYIIGFGRWLLGIPAEAVKRGGEVEEDIRHALLTFYTGLSTLSLLIFFFWLKRVYGAVASISIIALLVLTPFWQQILRQILAEPSIFLFHALAFGSTIWLVRLLLSQTSKPIWLIIAGTILVGIWIGLAGGIKMNGFLLFVGIIAVLLRLPWQTYSHYFFLIWMGAVIFLSAMFSFVLTNPFFWHANILERLQQVLTYRTAMTIAHLIRRKEHHLPDTSSSLQTVFINLFNMSDSVYNNTSYENHFTVLPAIIGLPLCLIGLWYGFRRKNGLIQSSHIWFLSIGTVNALVIPLNWDRYFIFASLSIKVFTGVGIAIALKYSTNYTYDFTSNDKLTINSYFSLTKNIVGIFCIFSSIVIVVILLVTTIEQTTARQYWKDAFFAKNTAQHIYIINRIIESDTQAKLFNNGGTILKQLRNNFINNTKSRNPATLAANLQRGELYLAHSEDEELKARVAHEMHFMGQKLALLADEQQTQGCYDINKQPVIEIQARETPILLVENGNILLQPAATTAAITITTHQAAHYHLRLQNFIPLPGHVLVGLFLDGEQITTFEYHAQKPGWYAPQLILPLAQGEHELSFRLLNIPAEAIFEATPVWAIHLYPAEFMSCTTGQLPLILPNWYQSQQAIEFVAPVPALYDITLTYAEPVTQPITGLIDQQPFHLAMEHLPDDSPTLTLPPRYLTVGKHTVLLSTSHAIPWEQLTLTPHVPSVEEVTPLELGSTVPQYATLTKTTALSYTWKWYDNYIPYDFYKIKLTGQSETTAPIPIIVSINDKIIGTTELTPEGTPAKPLFEELANGGTHTLEISPLHGDDQTTASLYAVQIEKVVQTAAEFIFAGSSMRWEKQYNQQIETTNSIVHLPPDITLSKNLRIETEGIYSVTVRYRNENAPESQLHFDIGGWPMGQTAMTTSPRWQEHTFTPYLIAEEHPFQLRWEHGNSDQTIDIIYLTVEKRK